MSAPHTPETDPRPRQNPSSASVLDHAFVSWRATPLSWHAGALVALVLLAVVRYADLLVYPEAWIDESIYQDGFRELQAGRSPYSHPGFYYPPIFAHGGAWLLALIGEGPERLLFRGLNLIGLVWIAWLAAGWIPEPRRDPARGFLVRLVAAALLVVTPVGVFFGFKVGNISFAIVSLVLAGVCLFPYRPIVSGVLLGLSVVLKPVAPVAIALLFAHPPGAQTARNGRLAAVVAGATAALLSLPFLDELGALLSQHLSTLVQGRILSSYRVLQLLGLPFGRATIFAALTALLMLLMWRRGTSHSAVVVIVAGGVVATAPAIWSHSMTVFYPVLVMAAVIAHRHWSATRADLAAEPVAPRTEPTTPSATQERSRSAALELILVALALIAVLYFQSGGFDHLASTTQLMMLLPLLLIPLLLVVYVLRVASRSSPEA